jgi:hypothetical protein
MANPSFLSIPASSMKAEGQSNYEQAECRDIFTKGNHSILPKSKINNMKQLMLSMVILFFIVETSKAQDSLHYPTPNPAIEKYNAHHPVTFTSEYYMARSKKLKTTGWILISAGAAISVTGYFVYQNQLTSNSDSFNSQINNTFGSIFLMAAGSAMVIVGIPVLIRSGYYKNKALDLTAILNLEPYQTGLSMKRYPAIGLKIQL